MPLDEIKNFVAVSERLGTAGQPSDVQLRDVMDAAAEKKVFVHCAANYRVSSFVALYLIDEARREAAGA